MSGIIADEQVSDRDAPPPVSGAIGRWTRGHVPGEIGVWGFVLADMVVFGLFFGVFLVARADEPALFAASRTQLDQALGALNTVVLLTSSLVVARGVRATRCGARDLAGRLFIAGAMCGVLFLLVKALEYGQKLDQGIDPGTNDFFMYFFIFTGIHAAHVGLGIAALLALRHLVGRPVAGEYELRTVESGASFWHMVDLLWVVLFPVLYLTPI